LSLDAAIVVIKTKIPITVILTISCSVKVFPFYLRYLRRLGFNLNAAITAIAVKVTNTVTLKISRPVILNLSFHFL